MNLVEVFNGAMRVPGVLYGDEFFCLTCKKALATAKKCRKCRVAFYCGKECRKKDWLNGHNVKCLRTFKKHKKESLEKTESVKMLLEDHARVDSLFRALSVQSTDVKKDLTRKIIEELSSFNNAEELVLYPPLRTIRSVQKRPSGDS